jgi:hypothetical protein
VNQREARESTAAKHEKAPQQFAHRKNFCRRSDHKDFEISLREKILSGSNTFASLIA